MYEFLVYNVNGEQIHTVMPITGYSLDNGIINCYGKKNSVKYTILSIPKEQLGFIRMVEME